MPIQNDRCSFEVVYRKNGEGVEVVDHVIVRAGLSDASVTLTIPQVYNLARLLDIVPQANDRSVAGHSGATAPATVHAQTIRSE